MGGVIIFKTDKMDKDGKILLEIYRRLYRAASPSADFDKLMEEAEINEWGQKDIKYLDYEIDVNEYEDILTNTLKEFKVPVYRRAIFKRTVCLGCSPKFKKD